MVAKLTVDHRYVAQGAVGEDKGLVGRGQTRIIVPGMVLEGDRETYKIKRLERAEAIIDAGDKEKEIPLAGLNILLNRGKLKVRREFTIEGLL